MVRFLTIGSILGLSAGLSPGPLLMLVITETLRHGTKGGVAVALAPMITDLPIILATVLILTKLSELNAILGTLALVGSIFVLFTGWQAIRTRSVDLVLPQEQPLSILKGVLTNFFSPHPYLFWLSVGGPAVLTAWAENPVRAVAFVAVFSVCIVGSKVLVAFVAGRSRGLLTGTAYGVVMKALGLALVVFAYFLLRDGLELALPQS